MNNSTNSTLAIVLNQSSDIIGYYLIPIICAIGLITNYCFLWLLSNKQLKHKIYENLRVKAFCDWMVCLVGVGYLNNECLICAKYMYNSYWGLFYHWSVIKIPLRIVLLTSNISEIYLILNRCISLYNPKSRLLNINKYYVILVNYTFCIIMLFSYFLSYTFEKTKTKGIYTWTLTDIGKSTYFQIYVLCVLIIENFLPIILLVILNLIAVIKFRKMMSESKALGTQISNKDRSERRFTLFCIILSCLFTLIKSTDIVTAIYYRLYYLGNEFIFEEISIMTFCRNISLFLNFSFHVFNSFFWYITSSNMYASLYLYNAINFVLIMRFFIVVIFCV